MPSITNALGQILYVDDHDQVYVQMGGKYLRNAQLSGMDLQGIDFRDCNLAEANFEGSNLSNCKFDKADLSNSNMRNAILDSATLKLTNLEGANLENASARLVNLEGANLKRAWCHGIDLTSSNLAEADLSNATLVNAKVADARFWWTRIDLTNILGVDFSGLTSLKSQYGGAFLTWTSTCSSGDSADWWPPREFTVDSQDPVFDETTRWPRGMRFPKQRTSLKKVAVNAWYIWIVLWLILSCFLVLGARSFVAYCFNSWTVPVAAVLISVIAELFRVVHTNRSIEMAPERYFSSIIEELTPETWSPNKERPDGTKYYTSSKHNRAQSYAGFLLSLLKEK